MFARTASVLAAAILLVPTGIAAAGTVRHSSVVSANPVDTTPHVLDGIVNALALVGNTAVGGGSFSEVRDAGSTTVLERDNLFAYNLATGRILTGFKPYLDRPVQALAAGTGGTVYAGGSFTMIDESYAPGLALLRLSDGSRVTGF